MKAKIKAFKEDKKLSWVVEDFFKKYVGE